jgi:hypothetical protein
VEGLATIATLGPSVVCRRDDDVRACETPDGLSRASIRPLSLICGREWLEEIRELLDEELDDIAS